MTTDSAATPRTRLSPENRKEQILEAARRLCMRAGTFDVSLADVAAEAHISRNLVYHYFNNHAVLLSALFDAEVRELEARISSVAARPDEAAQSVLRRLICAYLDFTAERKDGFSLLHNAPAAKPLIRERFSATQEIITLRLMTLLTLEDTPAARAAIEAATGFLMRFAYAERLELEAHREAAADLCLGVIISAADGVRKFYSA